MHICNKNSQIDNISELCINGKRIMMRDYH